MKIRSMKKKAALLAMAVAMSFGAGSALAVRAGSEANPESCRTSGSGWACDDGNTYEHCERVDVECAIDNWLFGQWFCRTEYVCR